MFVFLVLFALGRGQPVVLALHQLGDEEATICVGEFVEIRLEHCGVRCDSIGGLEFSVTAFRDALFLILCEAFDDDGSCFGANGDGEVALHVARLDRNVALDDLQFGEVEFAAIFFREWGAVEDGG